MIKPGEFVRQGAGAYAFHCAFCKEPAGTYWGGKRGSAATKAHDAGCRHSMVHGWLCPACAEFYDSTGGFDRPEEQLPF